MLSDSIDPSTLPEPFRTRVLVWRHTETICQKLPQPSVSIKHKLNDDPVIKRFDTTVVEVLDTDSFVAAQNLLCFKKKVAVLNLADDSVPLGFVATASGAQEESLARRSTLCKHLDIKMYPLDDISGIYSRNVMVFKDSEEKGYSKIKPFKVDILTVPGVRHPKLLEDGHMCPKEIHRMENKIRLMYQMALKYKVDRLVLGASSCGAWKANPEDVANAFKKIGQEYNGVCEKVVFAIMKPTRNMLFFHRNQDAQCNFDVFKRVLTA